MNFAECAVRCCGATLMFQTRLFPFFIRSRPNRSVTLPALKTRMAHALNNVGIWRTRHHVGKMFNSARASVADGTSKVFSRRKKTHVGISGKISVTKAKARPLDHVCLGPLVISAR